MKEIFTDVIQFRGTHYDFGFKQGEFLKDSWIIKNREQQWKVRKQRFKIDVEESRQVYEQLAPRLWEEYLGLQEALKWPMERVLLEFSGYRANLNRSGCSIYIGEDYVIRNYDYHPKTYDGLYTLFQPTDGGYAVIGVSQRVTGRSDGMNEKGLTMGYTFMNRKNPGNGFICSTIGRLILELCSNKEEAIDLLKEIPHRGSFSYTLFDKACEAPSIVETSPRRVEARQGYTCTNHFKILTEENRRILDDSKQRLNVMDDNYCPKLSANEAFKLLNGRGRGVFSDEYRNWSGTIHTSAYFPKAMQAWISLGGDQQPIKINFAKWLAGDNLIIKRILGEVHTDIPFLNMEKADWFGN